MDNDSKGQKKMDSGGGLLPVVEGHSLEKNKNELRSLMLQLYPVERLALQGQCQYSSRGEIQRRLSKENPLLIVHLLLFSF